MDISIQPLQRTIEAPDGANLLDTLLAHQIRISYSCMAGRCGTCRCQLDGQTVLACQTTLTENCTVDIPEIDEVVVHPARILKTSVTAIDDLTHDIKRLRLKLSKPFAFSPGQYATLQFTPDHIRPYSMAVTQNPDEIEFHVRRVPDGRVTSYVASTLKVGDTVRVSGPLGTAYLRRKSTGPIVCIAGGTGLAPVLSILRGIAEADMANPVHVYVGVRSPADVYGEPWLDALRHALPNLTVHIVVATGDTGTRHRTGMVTQAVDEDWHRMDDCTAYVAGAPAMVDAATALLQRKGLPSARIHADAFHISGT